MNLLIRYFALIGNLTFALAWQPTFAQETPQPLAATAAPEAASKAEFNAAVMAGFRKTLQAYQENRLLEVPQLLQETLELSRRANDRGGEAVCLIALAQVYRTLGIQPLADRHEAQAHAALEAAGDRQAAPALLIAAFGLHRLGRSDAALAHAEDAVTRAKKAGDSRIEGWALMGQGYLYHATGRQREALAALHAALRLQRLAHDELAQGWTLQYLGWIYVGFDQPAQALPFFEESLPLLEARFTSDDASILGLFADVPQKAWGVGKSLQGMAFCHSQLGNSQKALAALERAVATNEGQTPHFSYPLLLVDLSYLYQNTGRLAEAEQTARRGVALSREVGNSRAEGDNLAVLAALAERRGEREQALEEFQQVARLLGAASSHWRSVARLQQQMGHTAEAVATLQTHLQALEGEREALGGLSDLKVAFMGRNVGAYQQLVELLLERGDAAGAWEWAEKSKARALLDLLEDGKVQIMRGATPEEKQKLLELREHAARLNAQLVAQAVAPDANARRAQSLQQQIQKAETELAAFTNALYAAHPELARKRAARTATLDDVARLLPPRTALLSFLVGDDKTRVFSVTVEDGKPKLSTHELKIGRDALLELVDDFHDACADPRGRFKLKAKALYDAVLQPVAARLQGQERLIICPDGPLWGLPFQALTGAGDRYLLEQYEIVYAYSATAAGAALSSAQNAAPAPDALLAFANPSFGGPERFAALNAPATTASNALPNTESRAIPALSRAIAATSRGVFDERGGLLPLPGTGREAEALRASFPAAEVRTGVAATEESFKSEAGRYRFLHLATHGLFNESAPMLSSIVMSQPAPGSTEDGFLTARELFDLDLNAEMVVLSACDTGRGMRRRGEGVIGLTWALFVAGAPAQVVSQWAVNDDSTAALMSAFYAQLKAGQPKAAALRQAQLALLRGTADAGPNDQANSQWSHPYFWAPFVLMGDWR